jgi:hypothetical protein
MTSTSVYRSNAEECLRMANAAQDSRDRPLWVTLAQSWLRLAELSARGSATSDADDRVRQQHVEETCV